MTDMSVGRGGRVLHPWIVDKDTDIACESSTFYTIKGGVCVSRARRPPRAIRTVEKMCKSTRIRTSSSPVRPKVY